MHHLNVWRNKPTSMVANVMTEFMVPSSIANVVS